ncbi:MAG: riboflavin synthase [Gammaproteobacteria bacterium]|nr:riboflavin synthase [Gammaproteobacteria bacterium]
MFTGIVAGTGVVAAVEDSGAGDRRLTITAALFAGRAPALGDSVAVDGACLTAAALADGGFAADVSAETLACTTLGDFSPGRRVNLECALTPATPLGGHLVSGHVDATGELRELAGDARSVRMRFAVPASLARYIAVKGSVCVDGVSLTVNEIAADGFAVNIVPHTLAVTTLGEYAPGRRVNIEVDLVARYLERLLAARQADD